MIQPVQNAFKNVLKGGAFAAFVMLSCIVLGGGGNLLNCVSRPNKEDKGMFTWSTIYI